MGYKVKRMLIWVNENYSDMQGPCPAGFHVPTAEEWTNMKNADYYISGGWFPQVDLHIPQADYIQAKGTLNTKNYGYYWMSDWNTTYNRPNAFSMRDQMISTSYSSFGFSIRPFKDTFVEPDNSWTVIQGTIGNNGIFWNQTDGIISIIYNTTNITIADKNLGATTVYNNGNTKTEANCGKFYQWGNNNGFSREDPTITSSSTVYASTYGPGNYYSSTTFRTTTSSNWDSSNNSNLRGGTSQGSGTRLVEKQIYPAKSTEYIEYKMNADSSGNLYVPTSGVDTDNNYASYSWKVSIDGGEETAYSGAGAYGGKITLSGYTSGTNHTIMIKPVSEGYQWARAYGWSNTSGAAYLTEIIYDSSYMGYAVSATDTGNHFRKALYSGCTSLINSANEYLPDTVTTIGNYFCTNQYTGCTSLTYASEESLPSSVVSIGSYFRYRQYYNCSALTEIKGWKDLSIGNGSNYRGNQFTNDSSNKTVKVLSDVGYSSSANNTLQDAYVTSVSVPNQYLTNFKDTSNYPWVGIDDSKFIGY